MFRPIAMKKILITLTVALLLAAGPTIPVLRAAEVYVSAASSLTDALQQIATTYEKESGDHLVFNFAASSLLARQIEEGAPADLIFSADEAKLDALEKKGLLLDGTRRTILSNTLVIVVPGDAAANIRSARDLAGPEIKKIALGEPASVPAGIYAKTYLEKLGLWQQLVDKVVPVENVRAALAAVESGNVEAGIVYKTDAMISKKVKVAFEVPVAEGPPISYPLAVVKESREPDAAKKLAAYLASDPAKAVFEKYGFIVNH
jgi:molybdate transport system substrate-binding protein